MISVRERVRFPEELERALRGAGETRLEQLEPTWAARRTHARDRLRRRDVGSGATADPAVVAALGQLLEGYEVPL